MQTIEIILAILIPVIGLFAFLLKMILSQNDKIKDFGYRWYNPITKIYGIPIPFLSNMYPKKDLNSLFDLEFSKLFKEQLIKLYNSKSLDYPLIP